jgi:hypothetical protein
MRPVGGAGLQNPYQAACPHAARFLSVAELAFAGGQVNIGLSQLLDSWRLQAMKTQNQKSHPQFLERHYSRLACSMAVAMLIGGTIVQAQESQAKPSMAQSPASATDSHAGPARSNATNQPPAEVLSPTTSEVLRMVDAGVPTPVIQTYVECSPATVPLNAADIIELKKHNVTDEIVIALMKQGAKARSLDLQRKNEAAARALAIRNTKLGGLDPESYEYFQYYYLQPRALASVYDRLAPYYGPWAPYPARHFPAYRGYNRPR